MADSSNETVNIKDKILNEDELIPSILESDESCHEHKKNEVGGVLHIFTFMKNHKTVPSWQAKYENVKDAILKKKIPQLQAVYLTPGGCGFYGAVVQVKKDRKDVGRDAIVETFKSFEPLQRVVAVDTDVDLYDPVEVEWAVTTRFNPDTDLIVLKNQPGHILNPMVQVNPDGKGGTITKIGIDATAPYPRKEKFERVTFKDVNLKNHKIDKG